MAEPMLDSDAFYDAGDVGCTGPSLGDILRLLEDLPAGTALEVRSTTMAGRNTLRALCRLRGWAIEQEDAGPEGDRLLVRRA